MRDTVKIGIIGTGVGLRTHLPAFRGVPEAEVVAICGSSPERAEDFAREYCIPRAFGDYRALCDSADLVDLVVIATPNNLHYEHVSYALNHGKHILAEKPLAMNLREIEKLVDMAKITSRIAIINHQLRFNPYVQKVRSLIQNGHIGRPYFICIDHQSTDFSDRDSPWNWSFDERMGGGVRLAMGSHLIDLLWFWLGFRKVYHVKGAMDVVVPTRIDSEGRARAVSTCGFFSCSIALEGNVDVQLSATTASLGQYRFDFHVYGTKGELHFDLVKKLKGAFLKERGIVRPIPVAGVMPEELDNRVPFFPGSFLYFAPRIVEAVLANNWQPITDATTFDQAVPTQRVLEAIRDSAMKGGCVCLNDGYQPGARF